MPNIFRTMVRHRDLFPSWLALGGRLLGNGILPARERELLILRTACRCRSDYEWSHHTVIGAAAGLTETEIARVPDGPDAEGWSPGDVALLRAADELHDSASISDDTWRRLGDRFSTTELIELVVLVGHYHTVAFALNALGVRLEL